VKGISTEDGFGRTVGFAVSREFLVVTFDQLRHRVAGGFGHGGQDIHRYPGAR
jgi:hypothetical protein